MGMMRLTPAAFAASMLVLCVPGLAQHAEPVQSTTQPAAEEPSDMHPDDPRQVLGFTMLDIEGKARSLEEFRGKVVLIVNVASECGLTPQYEQLQALYETYEPKGLVILGFPANNFGEQEPGTEEQIHAFCTGRYGVSFPMFSKISVVGDDQHPLYAKLSKALGEKGGEPDWNFTKYLVDREGRVVERVAPKTKPNDPDVIATIEELLAQPVPEPAPITPARPAKPGA